MAKYYAQITGAANVLTNFNPYTTYTGNNNYIKLEYNGDIYNPLTTKNNGAVWYVNSNGWFSFELYYDNWQYMNFAGATYIGRYNSWDTNGLETSTFFEYNSGSATVTKGDQVVTETYNGTPGQGNTLFFPTTYATNLRMNFYRLRVYGQNDTLLYEFIPYLSGDTKGLYETINEEFFAATDQSKIALVSYSTFGPDKDSLSFAASGGSDTVVLDSEGPWTASTQDGWIAVSPSTGTTGGTITITAGQSYFGNRTGSITFTNGEDSAALTVSQSGQNSLCPITKLFYNGDRII